jgi:hypothetical protein
LRLAATVWLISQAVKFTFSAVLVIGLGWMSACTPGEMFWVCFNACSHFAITGSRWNVCMDRKRCKVKHKYYVYCGRGVVGVPVKQNVSHM